MGNPTWVLESIAFPNGDVLRSAAVLAGHTVVEWRDSWWGDHGWPELTGAVVFHGSLGNADRIQRELPWCPGAYCRAEVFRCTSWYPQVAAFLLHAKWASLPVQEFVADPDPVLERIGARDAAFVRPDSPLKPFSGRVLRKEEITLEAMDFGFYYDDPQISVIVAPVCTIEHEWRYVIVDNEVVAGSGYLADGRKPVADVAGGIPWRFAAEIARSITAPERVYVMDVCKSQGQFRLLELNPFGGADLYACDGSAVVAGISRSVAGQ